MSHPACALGLEFERVVVEDPSGAGSVVDGSDDVERLMDRPGRSEP